ncbi:MAG TPA: DUF2905 domain-containing protein [Candidatus Eisenbacteria bacterium]|nr:DUF2905 domain-containing protein [Candidatus Eisenbacteria bacterium]
MSDLGRMLVVAGLAIAVLGLVLLLGAKVPWLGRLPGDINVERNDWSFHFPIVTCLVVSVVLSLIVKVLFRR